MPVACVMLFEVVVLITEYSVRFPDIQVFWWPCRSKEILRIDLIPYLANMNPRVIYLIKRAEIEITSRMSKALELLGITPIQFTLLYFVKHDKDDFSSAQLSRRFQVTPQSMNELIAVLQTKKLLRKTVDPSHKRILRISLTPKGNQLLTSCNMALDSIEKELFEDLTNNEIDKIRDIIGKILAVSRKEKTQ
jgi:DNA-binding MarR family transcriptional regulator